jgi:hypothetical protein
MTHIFCIFVIIFYYFAVAVWENSVASLTLRGVGARVSRGSATPGYCLPAALRLDTRRLAQWVQAMEAQKIAPLQRGTHSSTHGG